MASGVDDQYDYIWKGETEIFNYLVTVGHFFKLIQLSEFGYMGKQSMLPCHCQCVDFFFFFFFDAGEKFAK